MDLDKIRDELLAEMVGLVAYHQAQDALPDLRAELADALAGKNELAEQLSDVSAKAKAANKVWADAQWGRKPVPGKTARELRSEWQRLVGDTDSLRGPLSQQRGRINRLKAEVKELEQIERPTLGALGILMEELKNG